MTSTQDEITTIRDSSESNSTESSSGFQISGVYLLTVLMYGGVVVAMVVLLIKRIVNRVQKNMKFLRQQNRPGAKGPKKLRDLINRKLDEVAQFAYEPKLFSSKNTDPEEPWDSDYLRMKTVDEFTKLIDEVFVDFNSELKRPMGKDICQHLLDVKTHSSACLKSIRYSHLHAVSDIYVHARFGQEAFGPNEYKRFNDLVNEIVGVLKQRGYVKKDRTKIKTPVILASKEKLKKRNIPVEGQHNKYHTTSLSDVNVIVTPKTRARTSSTSKA